MPAKNSYKNYFPDTYYHIYNRGVEKRNIFLEARDYNVFLSYVKEYLLPKDSKKLLQVFSNPSSSFKEKSDASKALRMNNFSDDISLIAYCLMPNHFHLLIHQQTENAIDSFMNSLATRYTMYINRKLKRVGPLYQGVYKAVLVSTEEQLLHLTRYIHRNPLSLASKGLPFKGSPDDYFSQPSSLPEYLGNRHSEWIHPENILHLFSTTNPKLTYKSFVYQQEVNEIIYNVMLDL